MECFVEKTHVCYLDGCFGVLTMNKNRLLWGGIVSVLFASATLAILLMQSKGGFGWWILLVHPHDPTTLLGVATAPLFSATLYEWVNNTCVMLALIIAGSAHGWRFVQDGAQVWATAGISVWLFGKSDLYYMGVSPVCYGMCAWLLAYSTLRRQWISTIVAVAAITITIGIFPLTLLSVAPIVVAVGLARR